MAFQDYSITPAGNTTLGDGTYIGPNMLRNKVRPALQQIAADGKRLADEVQVTLDIATGPAGPADAFRVSLAIFKAAAISDGKSDFDRSTWYWTLGNFTGLADDLNIVKADSTALSVGAWVRQKADAVTFLQAGTGPSIRSAQSKMRDMPVNPVDFGAVGDGTTNDTTAIRAAITYALASKKPLDLTTGTAGWQINGELDFTGLQMVYACFDKPINVDVSGTYPKAFAVRFGDPSVTFGIGRSDKLQIVGNLSVLASNRTVTLGGVYIKGAFLNIGAIRAAGFKGAGVSFDSVWDSVVGRISVELCGSVAAYSLVLDSSGDTTNATHIGSIQCEQAYQKGIYANLLRYKIDNIHSERLAITTTNDGSGTYNNHTFILSNSSVDQAVLHCLTTGTAPDGTALAATAMKIRMVGDLCAFNEIDAIGAAITTDFGTQIAFRNVICASWSQASPANRIEAHLMQITGTCSVERDTTLTECDIGVFSPTANAQNIVFNGGKITSALNFASNILGNIVFNNSTLTTIQDTRAPAAGYMPVTFVNCDITTFSGAFNARAVVRGGYVSTVALVSQAVAEFYDVEGATFGYTGNVAFLSRNCRFTTVGSWTVPTNQSWPAGTITERVGYDVAGKIYQQTTAPSGTAWGTLV